MNRVYDAKHRFAPPLENGATAPHDRRMTEVTRHEMAARLDATEARVALAAESMRSDMGQLRSEMAANAERAQANADRFYADAGRVLAEIRMTNSEHKAALYGVGYRVIAWTLGTILAVAGIAIGAYRAFVAAGAG